MGKHSKNNNDRPFFSNAERKAASSGRAASSFIGANDFKEWGWGTQTATLDSDSMKDIDACSLTLQPCKEPVVTPRGVLYDRGAAIEYILARKKEIEAATKAYDAQEAAEAEEAAQLAAGARDSRIAEFVAQQEGLSQADLRARAASSGSGRSAGDGGASSRFVTGATMGRSLVADKGVHAADTSFWVATNTPGAKRKLDKPDSIVRCPVTGDPLKMNKMTAVVFTKADESDTADELAGKSAKERYICPLTKKALTNTNPATVLRPSGIVVSSACIADFIRKDMLDPFTDPPAPLREKDIIPLRVEGTGFAARTEERALKVQKSEVGGGGGGGW